MNIERFTLRELVAEDIAVSNPGDEDRPPGDPDDPGWVYVWRLGGRVLYVGATWLPPRARAAHHLRGDTDDSRSVALRRTVAGHEEAIAVTAYAVDPGLSRAALRDHLIAHCRTAGWLAPNYVAQPDRPTLPLDPPGRRWLDAVLTDLRGAAT